MSVCSQLYEEVRKSLEQCNIQEDIEHFVNLRQTGEKPPGTGVVLIQVSQLSKQYSYEKALALFPNDFLECL